MRKSLTTIALIGAFHALFSSPCFSGDQDKKFEVGLGLGLGAGFYNQSYSARALSGLTFRFKPVPNFGLGYDGSVGYRSVLVYGFVASVMLDYHWLLGAYYYFTDGVPGLWLGVRGGLSSLSGGNSKDLYSVDTAFEWGPAAGYDFHLSDLFSLGVDLSYLMANFDVTSLNRVSSSNNFQVLDNFQILIVGKFHF
jgi:hypothetical protein